MKKLRVKDFQIKPYRTGSRLAGKEFEVNWLICTADGKQEVERGFSHKKYAQQWLSHNVKIANELIANGKWRA